MPAEIDLNPTLIQGFNRREGAAFENIYGLLYPDLLYFSKRLFRDSLLIPEDVLQDLFLKLWSNKKLTFDSVEHIKAYTYSSIRNYFRDYYSHQKVKDKYREMLKNDDDNFVTYMIETEIISELSSLPDLFPAECAKVLKLYLEGWDMKEIAEKLQKSPSTIYTQRQEIITILKKILNQKKSLLLFYISSSLPSN